MVSYDYSHESTGNYLCIDIKSFYASVECVERHLHPLKTMLVVMSRAENTGSGLVLAASPLAKKKLGVSNVTRARDLPRHKALHIVSPRMGLYIEKNIQINNIFRNYVADEDLLEYSIDESFINLTPSLRYFCLSPTSLAKTIQLEVYNKTGLYCTIGLGENPLLAKLAMDIEAKHLKSMFAEWRYTDVQSKLWPISPLSEVWGIGKRMEENLCKIGIKSVKELALTNPYVLTERFGIIGSQLFAHAWGIDRTDFKERYIALKNKSKSIGNSQILPRDYNNQEIKTVLREITYQVASRLRKQNALTECVHLSIRYSKSMDDKGFSRQKKVSITNQTKNIMEAVFELFEEFYDGKSLIRSVGINISSLTFNTFIQLSFFEKTSQTINELKLDQLIDRIRQKYDFNKIVYASSLLEEGTAISRSKLIGGHAGGEDYV